MRKKPLIVLAVLVMAMIWPQAAAIAQVPPHSPGTICATPKFWCWAVYPGSPGTRCACRTQTGWVQGVLI